jgi:hypothetical protein
MFLFLMCGDGLFVGGGEEVLEGMTEGLCSIKFGFHCSTRGFAFSKTWYSVSAMASETTCSYAVAISDQGKVRVREIVPSGVEVKEEVMW